MNDLEESIMKKSIKFMVILALVAILGITLQESVFAGEITWSATKTPGSTVANTVKDMPVYKGRITFSVTSLTGTCSYLVGKCVTTENDYYINNSNRAVMVSLVGGSDSFYIKYQNDSEKNDVIYLTCSVEHNASIGTYVSGSGKLIY